MVRRPGATLFWQGWQLLQVLAPVAAKVPTCPPYARLHPASLIPPLPTGLSLSLLAPAPPHGTAALAWSPACRRHMESRPIVTPPQPGAAPRPNRSPFTPPHPTPSLPPPLRGSAYRPRP